MSTQRILYVLYHYPQISETYIKVEIEELAGQYEIEVIALRSANYEYKNSHSYHIANDFEEMLAIAEKFQPDVIHTHWMISHLTKVHRLAKALNVPFTVRSHSFDTLWKPERGAIPKTVRDCLKIVNHPLCLGMMVFPYAVDRLIQAGAKQDKLVEVGPVFSYEMFNNQAPNGDGIVNVGACLPKKKFEDYIHLATLVPEREFHLYSLGYLTEDIKTKNIAAGEPVQLNEPIEHGDFPEQLKKMQWMVYTADPKLATVGLPMTLLEAQASGVGVCMRNLRPDLEGYLGGAGILYDSVEELVDIIKKPVPDDMRQKGFENAKKYDIKNSIHLLTDLWDQI